MLERAQVGEHVREDAVQRLRLLERTNGVARFAHPVGNASFDVAGDPGWQHEEELIGGALGGEVGLEDPANQRSILGQRLGPAHEPLRIRMSMDGHAVDFVVMLDEAIGGLAARANDFHDGPELIAVAPPARDEEVGYAANYLIRDRRRAPLLRSLGSDVVNQGAERSELYFDLTLVEPDRDRPRWRARSQLAFQIQGAWKQDVDAGVVFGTRIVEQLRDDRVIGGCPAKQASWPAITP